MMDVIESEGSLLGYGSQTWPDVLRIIGDTTCAWADYEGFHIGSAPTSPPPYSHLWAWSSDQRTMIRVRIDEERGIVGMLRLGPVSQPSHLFRPSTRQVIVRSYPVMEWGQEESRVTALPPEVRGVRAHELLVPLPVTFISMEYHLTLGVSS